MPFLDADRIPLDGSVLLGMHVALACLLLFAIFSELLARLRAGRGSATLTVTRGEKSMAFLTGIFATTVGLYAFTVEVANTLIGQKSFVILLDFAALTYLFFFNNWFRNALIDAVTRRHKEGR